MKKNIKVITINGFRGIVLAAFVLCGLVSGFVLSPAYGCAWLWNYISEHYFVLPHMEFYHGLILWAIIALSIFALCRNKVSIVAPMPAKIDEEKLKAILRAEMNKSVVPPFMDNIDINKSDEEQTKEEVKR